MVLQDTRHGPLHHREYYSAGGRALPSNSQKQHLIKTIHRHTKFNSNSPPLIFDGDMVYFIYYRLRFEASKFLIKGRGLFFWGGGAFDTFPI